MLNKSQLSDIKNSFALIGLMIACFVIMPDSLSKSLALVPRSAGGFAGIFLMPFVHVSLTHLIGNIIPLSIMCFLLHGLNRKTISILFAISITGGVLLWFFGRPSTAHSGASVLLFGLATFQIVNGLKARKSVDLAVCLFICLAYGVTMIEGILPLNRAISWDGHLCGAIAGFLVAIHHLDPVRAKSRA